MFTQIAKRLSKTFLLILFLVSFKGHSQRSDTTLVRVQIGQLRQCLSVNDSLQTEKLKTRILSQSNERIKQDSANMSNENKKLSKRLKRHKTANGILIFTTAILVLLLM